ncbi:MAG: hypothetical protein ACYC5X_08595 [Syntrophales bacterium]
MKVIFLMIIVLLALLMPVLWITGTLTSIVYFFRQRAGVAREERTAAINPQLGLTMADGGKPVDEKKNGSEAATQAGMTETPPASPERIAPRPVTGKMFWWGGYY